MSTCGTLFARMLDTVPRGVQLTEVVEPISVRPDQLILSRATNGSLILQGRFRVRGSGQA
jgi:hypothetical protein